MRFEETLGISHTMKVLGHELEQRIGAALEQMNLSAPQYAVLSVLEECESASNADLARRASVTPQTMNRIMQILEREGFVTKAPHPEHGLKLEFSLTPKAKKVVCAAHVKVNAIEVAMVKSLGKKGTEALQTALESCLKDLRAK